MNAITLYFLLLKATLFSFAGMGSLPIVHKDLVVERHLLTERQLNTAVAAGRMGPGPIGLYVVCTGYIVAGLPGAAAGCLALMTPAFLIIPMLRYLGQRATESEAVQRAIRSVILASAGLLITTAVPLARDALADTGTIFIALASLALLTLTRIDTAWVVLGAAAAGLAGHWLKLM